MKNYILILCCLFFSLTGYGQTLLIFGGDNHDVFLGCLNCNDYDDSSIWNSYGSYGSKYGNNSIWNQYSNYSGTYSDNSPFNTYANNPPVLVDADGNFYGYFTANRYKSKRTSNELALFIIENWKTIKDDVRAAYKAIFE